MCDLHRHGINYLQAILKMELSEFICKSMMVIACMCSEFCVIIAARGGSFQSVWESLVSCSCMDHKTLVIFYFLLSRLQKSDKFEPETVK